MKNNLNIKNKNKKFLGLGIGALVVAGAIGVAGYSTAKANQEVSQAVQYEYVEDSNLEVGKVYNFDGFEFEFGGYDDSEDIDFSNLEVGKVYNFDGFEFEFGGYDDSYDSFEF